MVVPGIIALAHNPISPQIRRTVPQLIRDILPAGLLGIFFASFLAAFMSSVDSSLNSAATLWTKDVYQRLIQPDRTERHYLLVGRLLTIVFIAWGIYFAYWIQDKSASIYSAIQTMLSLFQGPHIAVILLGILWWRTTGKAALIGLICGLLTSSGLLLIHNYASNHYLKSRNHFYILPCGPLLSRWY